MTKTNSNTTSIQQQALRTVAASLMVSGTGVVFMQLSAKGQDAAVQLEKAGLLVQDKHRGLIFSGSLQPCNWIALQVRRNTSLSRAAGLRTYRANGYSIAQARFFSLWASVMGAAAAMAER